MLSELLLVAFYFLFPFLLLWINSKCTLIQKIGPVLIAYTVGLIVGNIGVLNGITRLFDLQDKLNSFTILLAIPLLLFSMNIKSWFTIAGKALLSMILGIIGVVLMVILGIHLFGYKIDHAWKIGGMLVGVYSGGTPNLAALKAALNVDPETYVMVNTIDIILSTIYLLFLILAGKKFLGFILPAFRYHNNQSSNEVKTDENEYAGIFKLRSLVHVFAGLFLSILSAGISLFISYLITGEASMLIIILGITSAGIVLSLVGRINQLKYTFQVGMYLILVFCLVVSSMANLTNLLSIAGGLFEYISLVLFGSLLVHIILGRIFGVDTDTLMVTSTALICSPPFVPVVAGAIKNREVIVSGLTVGIIGYAIGNFLGISIAFLIK